MPIVIATCPDCGRPIEIDVNTAVVLTGHAETVWRAVRQRYPFGGVINVRFVADHTFLSEYVARQALNQLALFGLIDRPLKRPGGTYRHYVLPRPRQKLAKTA